MDLANIPLDQLLVVEHEGEIKGAVVVEYPQENQHGMSAAPIRRLITSINAPCPTCKQLWKRGVELEGKIRIIWPNEYRNVQSDE